MRQIHAGCASHPGMRRECCAPLPREERATRDGTFGPLCKCLIAEMLWCLSNIDHLFFINKVISLLGFERVNMMLTSDSINILEILVNKTHQWLTLMSGILHTIESTETDIFVRNKLILPETNRFLEYKFVQEANNWCVLFGRISSISKRCRRLCSYPGMKWEQYWIYRLRAHGRVAGTIL
jgi:hypothetical protein